MQEQLPADPQEREQKFQARTRALVVAMRHTDAQDIGAAYEHVIATFRNEAARRPVGTPFDVSVERLRADFEHALYELPEEDVEHGYAVCSSLAGYQDDRVRVGAASMAVKLTRLGCRPALTVWGRLIRDRHHDVRLRAYAPLEDIERMEDSEERRAACATRGISLNDALWLLDLHESVSQNANIYDPRRDAYWRLMAVGGLAVSLDR